MKAVVAAVNQEKALVGAFSVITNLRMELFETLMWILSSSGCDSDICYHGSLSSGHIVNCDLALLMEIRSKVATYVKIVM